jgi:hypothetical protein
MSMIERAQPLPPFPASMPQAKLDLTGTDTVFVAVTRSRNEKPRRD